MKTALLFLMICCYQTKQAIFICFSRGRHKNIDIYYISLSFFHLPKSTALNDSNVNILFKQTLRDNIPKFYDKAGLDMNLEECTQLCSKAWKIDY